MKTKIISIIVPFLIILIHSCTDKKQARNFIVPIDFSDSRDTTAIIWYRETVKNNILKNMSSLDRIIILPIDHKSEVWAEEIFTADFSKTNYSNEFAGLQSEEVEQKNLQDSISKAITRFDEAFTEAQVRRKKFISGTDIFGSLSECRNYVKRESENIIILFSDMQQSNEKHSVDLEHHLRTESEVDALVNISNPIDLVGAKIIVLTGPQASVNTSKYQAVKKFWEKFFLKSNAHLIEYSSGGITRLDEIVLADK